MRVTPHGVEKLYEAPKKVDLTSDIKEYQFAKEQGFTGSLLDFVKAKGVSGRRPEGEGNKLSIDEVKKLGLPFSLVGKSEQEIGQNLESFAPPQWFRDIMEQKLQQTIIPPALQEMWGEFKKQLKEGESVGTTSIENPFK